MKKLKKERKERITENPQKMGHRDANQKTANRKIDTQKRANLRNPTRRFRPVAGTLIRRRREAEIGRRRRRRTTGGDGEGEGGRRGSEGGREREGKRNRKGGSERGK